MSANVESMFFCSGGLPGTVWGIKVEEAVDSASALSLAGLDWKVEQMPVYTGDRKLIPGYKANVRDRDGKVLGVVTDRYKVVQNAEAFAFTDELLGRGVRYETAGSLQAGRRVWILARLPREYIITGEQITPYLIFSNSHDGSGAIKAALTTNPRCLPEYPESGVWTRQSEPGPMIHTGDIRSKLREAEESLFLAEKYMASLGAGD